MSSRSYDLNDEDYDRFVLGSNNGPDPDTLVILIIVVVAALLWWFK